MKLPSQKLFKQRCVTSKKLPFVGFQYIKAWSTLPSLQLGVRSPCNKVTLFFSFNPFQRLGEKSKSNFVCFLEEMKTKVDNYDTHAQTRIYRLKSTLEIHVLKRLQWTKSACAMLVENEFAEAFLNAKTIQKGQLKQRRF